MMTVSPHPIALTIVTEQRREEQFAQASHYRLAALAQGTGGSARRQRKADRHALAAVVALASALVAGRAAAESPVPQAQPGYAYTATGAAVQAHAGDSPHVSAVQKVREAAR